MGTYGTPGRSLAAGLTCPGNGPRCFHLGTPTCSEARSPSFIFLGLGSGCTSLGLEESQPVSTAACGYPMMQGLSIIKIWQGLPWWLRIYLPRLGTWVRSLVQEDPTGHGATKPRAATQEACVASLCSSTREATTVRSPCTAMKSSPRLAMTTHHNQKIIKSFTKKRKRFGSRIDY